MSLTPLTPDAVATYTPPVNGPVSLRDELAMWSDAMELAKVLAPTPFVPKELRNNPPAVLACILKGAELGVSALHALSQIHVIDGRPCLSAELQRALVLSRGHEIWFDETTITRAVICGRRAGSDHVQTVTYTIEDAKRANLAGKQNYRTVPRAMMIARATGELVRMMFADVSAGMSYNVEEVTDGVDDWDTVGAAGAPDSPPPAKAGNRRRVAKRGSSGPAPALPTPPLPGEEAAPVVDMPEAAPEPVEGHSGPDPDEPGPDLEPEEVRTKRATVIARRARAADIDHHDVVAAVTHGRKSSAKDLNAPEADAVMKAIQAISKGRAYIDVSDDDTPTIVEGEAPSLEHDIGDHVEAYHERIQKLRRMQQGQRGGQQDLPIANEEGDQ